MKGIRCLIVGAVALFLTGPLFADAASPSVSPGSFTLRVDAGWNTWILGSAISSGSSSTISNISASGLAGNVDFLFGPREGTQWGLGVAYLPMLTATTSAGSASLQIVPVVAEVFFNGNGPFYGDLGLGVGFLSASANASSISTSFAPSPGLLAKAGLGFNFKVSQLIGIDVGADAYIPFTDFGLGLGSASTPLIDAIVFSQFELKAGLNFNF